MSDISNQSALSVVDTQAQSLSAPAAFRAEVLEWIAQQARRGISGESLHHAMVQGGWAPDQATEAMSQSVMLHHPGFVANSWCCPDSSVCGARTLAFRCRGG